MSETLPIAQTYLNAGLSVLPAIRTEKRPAIGKWKQYQQRLPQCDEIAMWPWNDALCIICGTVSGNLEIIDFDGGGELIPAWMDRIDPDLRDRLVIESTPSGGMHVIYRCDVPVCGNIKLAQRKVDDKVNTLIETRGEGGLFLCSPTPGYEMMQGDLCDLPVLTEAQRDALLKTAWELNEYLPPVVDGANVNQTVAENSNICGTSDHNSHMCQMSSNKSNCATDNSHNAHRPGDDFNQRGDVRDLLRTHGWTLAEPGENEYWRRPGKDTGWSATLKDRVFYVFSSNADPFEPDRGYSPFAVYSLLEHGGDFAAATRTLAKYGFGDDLNDHSDVDLSGLLGRPGQMDDVDKPIYVPDPGPMPDDMLHVPGFISEVMNHCLETAPYPNPVMAFCGALTLLAFLAGRKVRDDGDNRTNIYLLGLAHSASGKDWPRKLNTRIIHEVGLSDALGERFASGEGIQDALYQSPCMMFQTDEIDGMLQSINKAKDARHESIMSTLLTMYSASNSVFPMRRKAGNPTKPAGVIDQPNLVVFGTAIPNHYYDALSERMLTNGFFARMIILEAGQRGTGQEPSIRELPPRVLEAAQWWSQFRPGPGNLMDWHPDPVVVERSDDARRFMVQTREEAEAEYAKAEANNDSVGTTVWGRVSEQTRKLALLYAISENHKEPMISLAAVQWASRFVTYQTRRMLFMAAGHVAENPFHAECLKIIQKLRESPDHELSHSTLLKRMKTDAKSFAMLMDTLSQQGEIEIVTTNKPGWPVRMYRLPRNMNPQDESLQATTSEND